MVVNNMMKKLSEQEMIGKDILIQLFDETFNAGALCCENSSGYPVVSARGCLPDILGYTTEESLLQENSLFSNLIYDEDQPSVLEVLESAAAEEKSFSIEFRCRKKDGTPVPLCGAVIYLKNTGHILLSFIKSAETIWDRIFRLLPCGICRVADDDVFTILQANEIYYDIYGYTSKEASAAGFTNEKFIIHPDDFDNIRQKVKKYVEIPGNSVFEMEHKVIMKDQRTGWVLVKGYIDRTAAGCCLNCVLLDISERKTAEESLRISEEQSRIAFLSTDTYMDIYDVQAHVLVHPYDDGKISQWPKWLENVPYSIIASGWVEGDSIKDYLQLFDSIIKGVPEGQCTVQMKNESAGSYRWYEIKYRLIFSKEGLPERAVLSYKDITFQREKELAYEKWSHFFDQQKTNRLGYYEYNLTKNMYAKSQDDLLAALPEYIKTYTEAVSYYSEHYISEEDKEKYLKFYNRERLLAAYYSGTKSDYLEYRRRRESEELFWTSGTVQLIQDP